MLELIAKWYPEDDPITREQVLILLELLGGELTEYALEGFLIFCSRFVEESGNHRTYELADIFKTDRPEGKKALLASLDHMNSWVGGVHGYQRRYPVTIRPQRPAFPQVKIIGIETIASEVYRAIDSRPVVSSSTEHVTEHVMRTGRLPPRPRQRHPVRRTKPFTHWCSYDKWNSPEDTQQALQIFSQWSDCNFRATISTKHITNSAFIAFSGDRIDPNDNKYRFYKYFFEPTAQDHPPLIGGGTQIAVDGAPLVDILERWNARNNRWDLFWERTKRSDLKQGTSHGRARTAV